VHPVSAYNTGKLTGQEYNDRTFQKENPTMEFEAYFKAIILFLALAVPIAIVILVYRTLFSGLHSIPKERATSLEDAEDTENNQNKQSSEKETK
jgi:hypothetical protein